MSDQIIPIRLPLPLNYSQVYSYLVKTDGGFILVDTGMTNARRQLENALERLCCRPGDLKLIVLTHGDFDHSGNAAYLHRKFNAPIAMHEGDAGMLENGDMFWNRKIGNSFLKKLISLFSRIGEANQCKPDLLLADGQSLAEYGLEAVILNTPGHSTGSICILTNAGDLLCGDLLTNSRGKPELNPLMYDKPAGVESLGRLKTLTIRMVYPGHGKAFAWSALAA